MVVALLFYLNFPNNSKFNKTLLRNKWVSKLGCSFLCPSNPDDLILKTIIKHNHALVIISCKHEIIKLDKGNKSPHCLITGHESSSTAEDAAFHTLHHILR